MASGFHRSVSLPLPNDGIPPEKTYHVRSSSLPCRSHPLISHLVDEVRATRAWQSGAELEGNRSPAWLRSGLIRLELLHLAVDDLLHLPKTRDSLRGSRHGVSSSGLAENLLEDFLVFADTYGSFRSALVSVQELQSEAQVSIRRGDRAHLSSVARSLRKVEKEVAGLSSAVLRHVSKSGEPASAAAASSAGSSTADAELAGILIEVKQVTVAVSSAVFQTTAAVMASVTAAVAPKSSSSSWTALKRKLSLTASPKKNKVSSEATDEEVEWASNASAKLQSLEKCVAELESGSERVFRNLMNSRVSLLNLLTP